MNKQQKVLSPAKVMEDLKDLEVISSPVLDEDENPIKGYKVIKRKSDNEHIRILSSKYQIYQHTKAYERILEKLEQMGLNYEIKNLITNTGSGRNSVQLSFAFPEIYWDVDGSKTVATLEMVNSNDGLIKYSEMFGAFRVICSNGLIVGDVIYKKEQKHSRFFMDKLEDIDFEFVIEQYEELQESIAKSKEVKATKKFIKQLLNAGFPAKLVTKLPEAYERYSEMYNETIMDYTKIWAYYALLTNWLTHRTAQTNIKRAAKLSQKLTQSIVDNT